MGPAAGRAPIIGVVKVGPKLAATSSSPSPPPPPPSGVRVAAGGVAGTPLPLLPPYLRILANAAGELSYMSEKLEGAICVVDGDCDGGADGVGWSEPCKSIAGVGGEDREREEVRVVNGDGDGLLRSTTSPSIGAPFSKKDRNAVLSLSPLCQDFGSVRARTLLCRVKGRGMDDTQFFFLFPVFCRRRTRASETRQQQLSSQDSIFVLSYHFSSN